MPTLHKRAALALLCALAFAQTDSDSVNARRLRADLQYLCSTKLQGRVSLSLGADAAARYIADEFKGAGLAPAAGAAYLQQFPLVAYEPDRDRTELTIVRNGRRTKLQAGTDFRGGFWREQAIATPLAFAGYGITTPEYGYDDYAAIDVRGKIALVFDPEP
jgi:hypothetical protein